MESRGRPHPTRNAGQSARSTSPVDPAACPVRHLVTEPPSSPAFPETVAAIPAKMASGTGTVARPGSEVAPALIADSPGPQLVLWSPCQVQNCPVDGVAQVTRSIARCRRADTGADNGAATGPKPNQAGPHEIRSGSAILCRSRRRRSEVTVPAAFAQRERGAGIGGTCPSLLCPLRKTARSLIRTPAGRRQPRKPPLLRHSCDNCRYRLHAPFVAWAGP